MDTSKSIIKQLGDRLKGKQKLWADSFLTNNENKTKASRQAGYRGNDNTLAVVGANNIRNHKIKAYIDACKAEDSEKFSITRESQLKDLEVVKKKALSRLDDDVPQFMALIRVIEVQNKMLGLNEPEKIEINGTMTESEPSF